MLTLAFDSSNQALSLALMEDQQVLGEILLTIKKNHSINLMPSIDYLLVSCDKEAKELDRIVVAKGPGSYTGIRMAVATAKTLAYALNIELVGRSSLEALLVQEGQGLQIPLVNARRNHVYAGIYQDGKLVREDAYQSIDGLLEEAARYASPLFVGEVEAFEGLIKETVPEARIQASYPSAAQLILLGQEAEAENIHAFEPAYLKRVEAEENWLKDHKETGDSYIKRV